jgi:hypothetical protein
MQSRRDFLKFTLAGFGTLVAGQWPRLAFARLNSRGAMEPHFFLQLYLPGGADSSYLFDARPLEMSKDGKIQNYLGVEPFLWQGQNGVSCLATELIKPLEIFKENFSILNGVLMTTTFDGHDQNLNYLMTGNAFGGDSFIPHLNQLENKSVCPMDGLISGSFPVASTNDGSMVPLTLDSFNNLQSQMKSSFPISDSDAVTEFSRSRMADLGQSTGNFSQGALQMLKAHEKSSDLFSRLLNVSPIMPVPKDDESNFINLALQLFKAGISKSAVLTLSEAFDVHAPVAAQGQKKLFSDAVSKVAKVFKLLKETPYDESRSFMDVTTVLLTSEFGRTMKSSPEIPVDQTGTDHNPLTNMMILAGKGIKGNQVIGASDYQTSLEVLSKAHKTLDPREIKIMGRPFDFQSMKPRDDKPETFALTDYLSVHSVVNTIYSLFGISETQHRDLDRGLGKAKILTGLVR